MELTVGRLTLDRMVCLTMLMPGCPGCHDILRACRQRGGCGPVMNVCRKAVR